jgi:hypothetical protein
MTQQQKLETFEQEKEQAKRLLKNTIMQIKRELPIEGDFGDILSQKIQFASAYIVKHGKIDTTEFGDFEIRTINQEIYEIWILYYNVIYEFFLKADFTYIINKRTRKPALASINNMKLKFSRIINL